MSDKISRRAIVFSLAYDPFWGGAEIAVREITKRLPEYRFDLITTFLDADTPRTEQQGNLSINRVGFAKSKPTPSDLLRLPWYLSKVFYPPLSFLKACALIIKHKPDFMWVVMSYAGFGAAILSFLFRIPLVMTLQEGDSVTHMFRRARIRPFAFLIHLAFRRAHSVQAISRYLASLSKDLGFKGEPVVIPNGVDIHSFTEVDLKEVARLRADLRIPDSKTVLVTTSRLVEKNGLEFVLRALPKLSEEIFVIVGDGPLRASLEKLANDLGVQDRVRFVGAVPYEEIPIYLKLGQIFIRPSLSEGLGSSFIEAMASGIPVIATQEGGIADFLFDPERNKDKEPTGRAVRPRDAESIVGAVRSLLEDKATTERIVSNAKRMADKYDWSSVAERMQKEVFDRLV